MDYEVRKINYTKDIRSWVALTNFDISNYEIPEKPLCSLYEAPEVKKFRQRLTKPCVLCGKKGKGNPPLCKNHLQGYSNSEACENKTYSPHIKHGDNCSIEGCSKKVFSAGKCNTHWREWKKAEGLLKKAKKKLYTCEVEGCDKRVFLQKLCIGHWKEKNDVREKQRGRPKVSSDRCMICEEISHEMSMCRHHYLRYSYLRRTKKIDSIEQFVTSIKQGTVEDRSSPGKEGKLGEKYVRLEPNGRYSVVIKRKKFGTFITLQEAIERRNEVIKEEVDENISC